MSSLLLSVLTGLIYDAESHLRPGEVKIFQDLKIHVRQ